MFQDALYNSAAVRVWGQFFHSPLEGVYDELRGIEIIFGFDGENKNGEMGAASLHNMTKRNRNGLVERELLQSKERREALKRGSFTKGSLWDYSENSPRKNWDSPGCEKREIQRARVCSPPSPLDWRFQCISVWHDCHCCHGHILEEQEGSRTRSQELWDAALTRTQGPSVQRDIRTFASL